MATEIVFETHATSEDNEAGLASGWHQSRLSDRGRLDAEALGRRRKDDGLAVVFTSDLRRAMQTAAIAFDGCDLPVLADWRLRECNYGAFNGTPAHAIHARRLEFLDLAYEGGESWREAVQRVSSFLVDAGVRWSGRRILVIGHVATRWGLQHFLDGVALEDLVDADFAWQEGWEFRLS